MSNFSVKANEPLCDFFGHVPEKVMPFGNGHINSTFLVEYDEKKYILQKINTDVFTRPREVMANIKRVTDHIRQKAAENGGDVKRCTLDFKAFSDGNNYFFDTDGGCWRIYEFIDSTVAYDKVESARDFYNCANAFGIFQQQLADYPAHTLCETITNFHNTPVRYENLMKAIEKNASGRADEVADEIAFAVARKEFCETLERAHASGELPLRVTHNDTKLNNILFDEVTGEPVCVIDLDTVMPGYSVNDFGDSIRFGANTAVEDETDLSKVSLDLELFRTYAEGFLKGCNGSLTPKELELLPVGAMMMTLECGMRFLTDHIDGDVYFRIHREGHNLDRCRCQFALVADMEKKLPEMNAIIKELAK